MAEEVIGLLFGVDGGGSIDGRSGQQIVSDLTKIVNKINSGKSTVPKVQLKFDTSNVKTALQELKAQLREIADMGSISVSGMPSRGGSGGSAGVKQDTENYRALTATVKQYYAELAKIEKIQMKSNAVSFSGDVWSTTDSRYDTRIEKINLLKTQFDSLGVSIDEAGNVEMNSAQQLNITEQQRSMLLAQVRSAIIDNGVAHKDSERKISDAWDKSADKATQYVRRIEDVASKNADVKESMDKVLKLAASGDPKNLDALTNEFAKLRQKVRETEADVKTWGDRFKKTFGNEVRSVLAATLVAVATKYLREIYTNVVNLDKAMTDLQIASGKTREEVKSLTKTYSALAQQLGSTTVEIAQAADTWLRQGYSAEEANMLIRNSTMLAKLGQMESAEASRALTSAMKGYGVAVEDSIGIVDKLTKVDMEAAASAGDIATAMAETATSAKLSGVSMDKLIGYITTVKEVTQDGAESVGVFFKTLFARMNNVAAGKFIDDETGESLNDVESVLRSLDIELRGVNGEFRNSSDVLDEVASRWNEFNDTERNAIATAMAGTRNFEKFNVLMSNYGTATEYATDATNASGTALDKYGAYVDSIEGKMNSLKATFEEFSMNVLNSDWVSGAIDAITGFVEALDEVAKFGDGIVVKAVAITAAIIALAVAFDTLRIGAAKFMATSKGVVGFVNLIPRFIAALFSYVTASASATGATKTFKGALESLKINPWVLLIEAIVVAIVTACATIDHFTTTSKEAAQEALDHAKAMKEAAQSAKEEEESLESLIDQYVELKSKSNIDEDARKRIRDIQKEINVLTRGQVSAQDMVNGSLADNLKLLNEIKIATAQKNLETYSRNLAAANNAFSIANVYDHEDASFAADIADGVLGFFGSDAYYESNELIIDDGEGWDEEAFEILRRAAKDYVDKFYRVHDISGKHFGIDFKSGLTGQEYLEAIEAMMDALADPSNSYDYLNSPVYNKLAKHYTRLSDLQSGIVEARDLFLERLVSIEMGLAQNNGTAVESVEDYDALKEEIYNTVVANDLLRESFANEKEMQDAVSEAVAYYMSLNYPEIFERTEAGVASATLQLKPFVQIMGEVSEEYKLLSSAISDMDEFGYLSEDTLSQILDPKNGYPALAEMLKKTANGYTISTSAASDFLDQWIKKYEDAVNSVEKGSEEYNIAVQNYINAVTAKSTLELQKLADATSKSAYELKSFVEILNEVKGGFDALSSAIGDMNEQGFLSVDTVVAMLDQSNGLPALGKYLTLTAKGYTISSNAMSEYLDEWISGYVAALAVAKEGTDEYNNAYQNLAQAIAIKSSLQLEAAVENETEAVEDNSDAWREQVDQYKKLIDLRKKLLETYKSELEYQKELEKKQRNVSALQTKLSIARLDASAAGQMRVRELEAELREAQEELDDFTLEHAIDTLINQLDNQYAQYENYIDAKVSEITNAINGVTNAVNNMGRSGESIDDIIQKLLDDHSEDAGDSLPPLAVGNTKENLYNEIIKIIMDVYYDPMRNEIASFINDDVSQWRSSSLMLADAMDAYIALGGQASDIQSIDDNVWKSYADAFKDGYGDSVLTLADYEKDPAAYAYGLDYEQYIKTMYWKLKYGLTYWDDAYDYLLAESKNTKPSTPTTPTAEEPKTASKTPTMPTVEEPKTAPTTTTPTVPIVASEAGVIPVFELGGGTWKSYEDAARAGYGDEVMTFFEFASKRGGLNTDSILDYKEYLLHMQGALSLLPESPLIKQPHFSLYHEGGAVGGLSSNEEFAKLLKGEFVTTPAQMKRFMEQTLPQIASYSATGGSNEFNAPLIEITCESVTTEALPGLEHVVNEAVKEIKKQLDSGMSRTGFKRTQTKRLT